MKNFFCFHFIFFLPLSLLAQIPAGYYDAANGKTNGELKTSLYQIIKVGNDLVMVREAQVPGAVSKNPTFIPMAMYGTCIRTTSVTFRATAVR